MRTVDFAAAAAVAITTTVTTTTTATTATTTTAAVAVAAAGAPAAIKDNVARCHAVSCSYVPCCALAYLGTSRAVWLKPAIDTA